MTAQRPDPFAFKVPVPFVVEHQIILMEIGLRSLIALRPDLVSILMETELRSFVAQRPDHFLPLPAEGSARIDTKPP